jgi:hypothetical protein
MTYCLTNRVPVLHPSAISARLASGALPDAEDAPIFRSPNCTTRNQNGYDSRALQE